MMKQMGNFEAVWSEEAALWLREDRADTPADAYVDGLLHRYRQDRRLRNRLITAAQEIVPFDREEGFDHASNAQPAFVDGGILALHICNQLLTTTDTLNMFWRRTGIRISNDGTDPNFSAIQIASGQAHMELGDQGWEMAEGAFGTLMSEWGMTIRPEASEQRYLRPGFGFIVYLAAATKKQYDFHEEFTAMKQNLGTIDTGSSNPEPQPEPSPDTDS